MEKKWTGAGISSFDPGVLRRFFISWVWGAVIGLKSTRLAGCPPAGIRRFLGQRSATLAFGDFGPTVMHFHQNPP